MKEYILKGSNNKENIDRRIAFLTKLYEKADEKGTHLSELRQKSMNYALVIFAAMFTFTMRFSDGFYSVFVSLALLCIMFVFCKLDRRFHQYIHGWRRTKTNFMEMITVVVNNPERDIIFRRYWKEGEKTAEINSLQPIIFYFLIFAGFVHLSYFVVSTITKFLFIVIRYIM